MVIERLRGNFWAAIQHSPCQLPLQPLCRRPQHINFKRRHSEAAESTSRHAGYFFDTLTSRIEE